MNKKFLTNIFAKNKQTNGSKPSYIKNKKRMSHQRDAFHSTNSENFKTVDKWYENLNVVQFRKVNHSTENSGRKVQWNANSRLEIIPCHFFPWIPKNFNYNFSWNVKRKQKKERRSLM